jgi:putative transposase
MAREGVLTTSSWKGCGGRVKYEDVYLKGSFSPKELREGLKKYFRYYNERRPHQSLGYKSPMEIQRMNGSSVARKAGA